MAKKIKAPVDQPPAPAAASPLATLARQVEIQTARVLDRRDALIERVGALGDVAPRSVKAAVVSGSAVTKGVEEIHAAALFFGRSRIESGVAQAKRLTAAKTPLDAFNLHRGFIAAELKAYNAHFHLLTELTKKAVADGFAPLTAEAGAVLKMVTATTTA